MANFFTDSFSHYSTLAQIQEKWNGPPLAGSSVGASFAIGAASQGLQTSSSAVYRNLGPNFATGVFGARFNLRSTSNNIYANFVQLLDVGTIQLSVSYNTSGLLSLYRGTNNLLGSVSMTIAAGSHTIELVPVINSSTGSCSVYIDNVLVLTVTGVNTSATGNAYLNQIAIGDFNQFKTIWWGDVYFNDFTGAAMNARLGNWSISPYTVSAAGGFAQFTPAGTILGTNAQQLAKALADATSFNQSNVVNQRDSFTMVPVPSGTLLGARQWLYAQKDSSGARQLALTLTSGSTDSVSAGQAIASGGYTFYGNDASLDPATGALWASLAALNAAYSGYKITV